ncbi:phosphate uptake regulator PhoU [Thermococcus sp.]|uniref:phosphate signaling complex PhoU family protein n=1 Tax=Thermococcus sp. TaxID=35749 RepID=UPI000F225148|nr:phosphate uptake regulator PhoU [Thermococcus sp.]RLF76518.1 MAG: phosphate uptake regulator PhoU [Thermococci archaeon]MCD6142976.1 phosphate uptake regulator PhoU [Thermococcus sp.]RLF80980.1 MAG: phosphate uptake regulator PhoU [Thermococci archaeon]RLF85985.1 MAG: phosphate uptake regulator PhoU [Thermococci archaeon]RLF87194.1 MAG: phosphate uptake regulator PhoU [Thermococci archaeon]
MEFRKIQFTGRSSYIISLPKKWVKENELKQGDVVPIAINPDGSLLILPKKPKEVTESKELVISKEISPDMAVRLLISAYIQGYDIIDVKFTEDMPLYKVKIRQTIQNLPGLEIILEEPLRITSKSLLADEEVNLKEIIERLTSILVSMIEDLALINEFERKEVLRDINGLENELDRFYFLTLRTVNKALSGGSIGEDREFIKRNFDLLGVLFIVRNIERIGDHIVRIAENFDPDLDIEYLKGMIRKVMSQITEKDLKKIDEIMLELKNYIESIDYRKSIAMDSYRRVLEYIGNIGETIINMSLS